jgi:hypothetical protein
MAISNEVVRGGGRNRGAVSAGGDEILPPPFRLHVGAHAISMVAATRAGLTAWLWGYAQFGGIPKAWEGALTCVWTIIWIQPKNPINSLLAPHGLVQLLTGYQLRPRALAIYTSCAASSLCRPGMEKTLEERVHSVTLLSFRLKPRWSGEIAGDVRRAAGGPWVSHDVELDNASRRS